MSVSGRLADAGGFDGAAWAAAAEENRKKSEAQSLETANINLMAPEQPVEPPHEIPTGGEAEAFLAREAEWDHVTLDEKRREVELVGFGQYVLDALRSGRVRFTEAWNALETDFFGVLQLAYSNGAMDLTADDAALFTGQPSGLAETIRNDPDLVVREIEFTPSFDPGEASPQLAEIAFDPNARGAPVVICQHGGYPGSRMMELPTIHRLAAQGIFAIAVSKRGRDGSAGQPDAWCKETADIVDALDHCEAQYGKYLDPTNVTVRGGSGGGIDSISLLVRYPDRFRYVIPFFGYADLSQMIDEVFPEGGAAQQDDGRTSEDDPRTAGAIYAVRRFGYDSGYGRPDYDDRQLTRLLTLGAENNPYAQVLFAWDEDDPMSPKMDEWFEVFRAAAERTGAKNVRLHRSKRGDLVRYPHWLASDNDAFDRFYVPAILSKTVPAPVLAPTGFLTVLGFLKTRPFEIVLGDGDNACARLDYETGLGGGRFRFRRLSRAPETTGLLRFRNPRGRRLVARIGDNVVAGPSTDEWISCRFDLDDTVVVGDPDGAR